MVFPYDPGSHPSGLEAPPVSPPEAKPAIDLGDVDWPKELYVLDPSGSIHGKVDLLGLKLFGVKRPDPEAEARAAARQAEIDRHSAEIARLQREA